MDGRSRDRDAAGRPRNARPRDDLGRPLPYGTTGAEPLPNDLRLTPAESLTRVQALLDAGRPFQAHEVLEAAWKSAPDAERALWRGLAQLAVGLTHLARGRDPSAVTLLRRGADTIAGFAGTSPYGVDVDGLRGWASDLADAVAGGEKHRPTTTPALVGATM